MNNRVEVTREALNDANEWVKKCLLRGLSDWVDAGCPGGCFKVTVDWDEVLAAGGMKQMNLTDKATPQEPEAQDMPRETGETSEGPT